MSGRTSIGVPALLREARAGLEQRVGRTALTALGSLIGVMSLVLVLGLTESAGAQITRRFDLAQATEVRAVAVNDGLRVPSAPFPTDAEARLGAIDGVTSVGISWGVAAASVTARSWERSENPARISVKAVTPGTLAQAGAVMASGVGLDAAVESAGAHVAVVGRGLVGDLGLGDPTLGSVTVTLDGVPFTVIGIIGDVTRHADLLRSVVIPSATAVLLWGQGTADGEPTAFIGVRTGAAAVVGAQVATALDPVRPDRYTIQIPPDPQDLREGVQREMQWLFAALAAVCLLIGMVGIANTTYVAVLERRGEIGLRRSMGARPRDILGQFLIESSGIGLLGGLVGTSLGVVTLVGVCVALGWTAVLPLPVVVAGPLIGVLSGALAGLYPALRASRVDPITVLRS